MRSKAVVFILWAFIITCVITCVPVFKAHGHCLTYQCTIFAEPGDSLIKLFGADWLRVFQANSNHAFLDGRGRLISTPDKLVVGERLIVPSGTYLTDLATERLNRYEGIKKAAQGAIREAERFVDQENQNRFGAYQQGLDFLAKAKRAKKGLTYGLANYVEARELAEKALRYFTTDEELRQKDQKCAQLAQITEEQKAAVAEQRKILSWQRKTFLCLLIIIVLIFSLVIKHRKKKERSVWIEKWLDQQLQHIKALEKVRP